MERKIGITGNLYFTSQYKQELEEFCTKIGKSKKSVYYNKKYRTYAIRIKSKLHKRLADLAL